MSTSKFFDESREQSLVKAEIVEKYFDAWAGIITGAQNHYQHGDDNRIGYIDLFAGPGRYKDGAASTPLRVLQKAVAKPQYAERLLAIFNDKDAANVRSLETAIRELPDIGRLKTFPTVWNEEIGDRIATSFASIKKIPILAFIDPWGYKGLTLQLVESFLKDWGCDCLFFFNYARINAGLSNPLVHTHMCALFGEARAAQLRDELGQMDSRTREATIVNALAVAFKEFGHRFVLPFCFKNETGKRTSHHLILVTKHFKGYEVMKSIMANSSSEEHQGVPSFTYSPAADSRQQLLFDLNRPLDDLRGMLLKHFAGRTLSMREIYQQHSVDTPFLDRNYKAVLKELETSGAVTTAGRKSNRGFADHIKVTFPSLKR